jgi:hypothetical protein
LGIRSTEKVKKAEYLSLAVVKTALISKQEGFLSTPIAFLSHTIGLHSTSSCLEAIAKAAESITFG